MSLIEELPLDEPLSPLLSPWNDEFAPGKGSIGLKMPRRVLSDENDHGVAAHHHQYRRRQLGLDDVGELQYYVCSLNNT